jgi:hypothetical protein
MKRLALTVLWCACSLCAFGTAQAATPTIAQRTIGSSIHNLNANTVTYRFPDPTGANNLVVCGITGGGLTSITATDDKSNSSVNHISSDVNGRTATVANELRYSEVFVPLANRQQFPIKSTSESLRSGPVELILVVPILAAFTADIPRMAFTAPTASADPHIDRRDRPYLCKGASGRT